MTRIALIGNCQISALAQCIEYLSTGAQITQFSIPDPLAGFDDAEDFFTELRQYDHVFSQDYHEGFLGTISTSDLKNALTNLTFFPIVYFSGFHPDMVYAHATDMSGEPRMHIKGPTEEYHSALALYGHINKFSDEEILSLFTEDVFSRLGYFNIWKQSEQFLLAQFQNLDFQIFEKYIGWVRSGIFMHVNNHPSIRLFADLAQLLLGRSKIPCYAPERVESYLGEQLNHIVWPVYPEIALRLGCDGGYTFKSRKDSFNLSTFFDLSEYISRNRIYFNEFAPDSIYSDRTNEWQSDSSIVRFLEQAAGRL